MRCAAAHSINLEMTLQRNKYIEIRLKNTIAADEIAPIAKIFAPSFPTPSIVRKNPIEAMIGARLILAIIANVSE